MATGTSTSFGPTRRPSPPTSVPGERVGWPTASPGTPAARLRLAPEPRPTRWGTPPRADGSADWGRWSADDEDRDADRRAARAPGADGSWDDRDGDVGDGWADDRGDGWADGRGEGWVDGRGDGWADDRGDGWADDSREGWADDRGQGWADDLDDAPVRRDDHAADGRTDHRRSRRGRRGGRADEQRDGDRRARWDDGDGRWDGRSGERWDDDRDPRAAPTPAEPGAWSGSSPAANAPYTWRERLAERWLPAGWVRARWDPGRAGALALALVAALAAVVAAVGVWSGRPTAEPVPALPVVEGAPVPRPGAAASPAPGALLVVSVAGRVEKPGLVRVPDGARVGEAVAAAGGVLAGTDTTALNLAAKVSDGEQILVGVAPPPVAAGGGGVAGGGAAGGSAATAGGGTGAGAGAAGAAAPGGKVSLNAATLEQLDGLPGVGPVTAKKILDWRTQNGRFTAIEQLREISGIGEARFGTLKDQVTL